MLEIRINCEILKGNVVNTLFNIFHDDRISYKYEFNEIIIKFNDKLDGFRYCCNLYNALYKYGIKFIPSNAFRYTEYTIHLVNLC